VISSVPLLHSSHALTSCPGNSVHHYVCVCVCMCGGLQIHRVKIICHQRGLVAHGLVKGLSGAFAGGVRECFIPYTNTLHTRNPRWYPTKTRMVKREGGWNWFGHEHWNSKSSVKCEKDWAKGETALSLCGTLRCGANQRATVILFPPDLILAASASLFPLSLSLTMCLSAES
jgi:hypothetical protein